MPGELVRRPESHAFLKAVLRGPRKVDRGTQAAARRFVENNARAMALSDRFDDGKPEAGAAFLRCGPAIEAIEHALAIRNRDAGACIGDVEHRFGGCREATHVNR